MERRVIEVTKELESAAVIRFQDCDPFGHLNNARYIDYFLNARQDQVAEHYGLQFFERGKQESWVATKMQLAFLSPAVLMERVLIRTQLIEATDSTLVVESVMLDQEAQRPKAIAWAEFSYISLLTGKRATHTVELMQLFRSVLIDEAFDKDGFNRRVEALKVRFRKPPGQ